MAESAPSACLPNAPYCDEAEAIGIVTGMVFGKGVSWVDVDGDDWEDLWLSDSGTGASFWDRTSQLFRNQGDGTFAAFPLGLDVDHMVANWAGVWGDYDNDGDPDLFLVNGSFEVAAPCALYRNDLSEGRPFVDVTESAGILTDAEHWWGGSWADIEPDGDLDLVVVGMPFDDAWEERGRLVLYRNSGDGSFDEASAALGLAGLAGNAKNPVWIDYDRDGDPDLYVAGMEEHRLYRNDLPAGFTDVTTAVLDPTGIAANVWAAAAVDFDQDGWDDLYLGRYFEQDFVLRNEHDGSFVALGREIGLDMKTVPNGPDGEEPVVPVDDVAENTMGLGVGDINDDGYPDVIIGTGDPRYVAPPIAYCNQGSPLRFERCTSGFLDAGAGPSRHHGIALGDYDQDFDTDVLLNRGGVIIMVQKDPPTYMIVVPDEPVLLARGPRSQPETALVRLEGTASNRDAVGARIEVGSDPPRHYAVRSAQAFQSQNGRWMTVQLSGPEAVATITWPSGTVSNALLHRGEQVVIREPADPTRPDPPIGVVRNPPPL